MFAFLRGTVALKSIDHIALDVNGVGYKVFVPDTVHRRLVPHQEVTLLTYCHIREDVFHIFGFLKEEELALFRMLMTITGIGPKVAQAVVGALPVSEFGRAILESDVNAFTRVPGVGKKMAQRIVLEMKTKMGQDPELSKILGESDAGDAEPAGDDVYEALIALGCTPPEAKKAAAHARKELGADAPDNELVRVALRSLARVK
jgi:Holliday junction DNA helicase RuvA